MAEKKILYYGGSWPPNIGNAFIDLGSIQALKMAFPDAKIFFASELPTWLFTQIKRRQNVFSLAKYIECDYVVVSGMNCCQMFIDTEGEAIRYLSEKGVKVIFSGCGQRNYDEQETTAFRQFLSQLNLAAFISRDSVTYGNLAAGASVSFDGIDCAFFLPEAYEPPSLDMEEYVIYNFDSSLKDLNLATDKKVVNLHHSLWPYMNKHHVDDPDCLISDIPYDYLTLYANTSATYSDRVHACIATLAYGKRARLYASTPRANLFKRIGAGDLYDRLVEIDMDALAKIKTAQIEFLRDNLK